MKVLKHGTGQNGWSKKLECTGKGNGGGGCDALLLIEQTDLYKTYRSFMDGEEEIYVNFTCCECSVETIVENVPLHIKDQIPSKKDFMKKAKKQ